MPRFDYQARSAEGRAVTGQLEAISMEVVASS